MKRFGRTIIGFGGLAPQAPKSPLWVEPYTTQELLLNNNY